VCFFTAKELDEDALDEILEDSPYMELLEQLDDHLIDNYATDVLAYKFPKLDADALSVCIA
jgi:hypothetical protein